MSQEIESIVKRIDRGIQNFILSEDVLTSEDGDDHGAPRTGGAPTTHATSGEPLEEVQQDEVTGR